MHHWWEQILKLTQAPISQINGVLPRVEMKSSFLELSLCFFRKKNCHRKQCLPKNPIPFIYPTFTPTSRGIISQMQYLLILMNTRIENRQCSWLPLSGHNQKMSLFTIFHSYYHADNGIGCQLTWLKYLQSGSKFRFPCVRSILWLVPGIQFSTPLQI